MNQKPSVIQTLNFAPKVLTLDSTGTFVVLIGKIKGEGTIFCSKVENPFLPYDLIGAFSINSVKSRLSGTGKGELTDGTGFAFGYGKYGKNRFIEKVTKLLE